MPYMCLNLYHGEMGIIPIIWMRRHLAENKHWSFVRLLLIENHFTKDEAGSYSTLRHFLDKNSSVIENRID